MMHYTIKKTLSKQKTLAFQDVHHLLTSSLEKYGIDMMRIALAIVFIWFGALKMVGMSPAQLLIEKTIYWFSPKVFVPFLGFWEVCIGLGFLIKRFVPYTVFLLLFHMMGTFLPMFILRDICFDAFPFCPSMEGQYIIKNLVLIAGALAVAGKYKLGE